MWLVANVSDRAEAEHCHHSRMFFWTALRERHWLNQEKALPCGKTIVQVFPPGRGGGGSMREGTLSSENNRTSCNTAQWMDLCPGISKSLGPSPESTPRRGQNQGVHLWNPLSLHRKRTSYPHHVCFLPLKEQLVLGTPLTRGHRG